MIPRSVLLKLMRSAERDAGGSPASPVPDVVRAQHPDQAAEADERAPSGRPPRNARPR